MDDKVMGCFDPWIKTNLKSDAGPGGMADTMKQYDHSRAFTDTASRYSQLERKRPRLWSEVSANQIYLYDMATTLDTDHKPLVLLLSGHRTTASLCIERM